MKYQKNYSEKTIENYELDIIKYEQFLNVNNLDYTKISYLNITDYLIYLNKLDLKSSSIARNLSALRSYYNYLLKKNIVNTNIFKLVSSPKREKKLPNYLQYNEFESILNSCGNDNLGIRNRAIVELLLASGLRVSELVNIKLNDLDFNEKSIRVIGKGKKERIVYFGDYALRSLNEYLESSREYLLKSKNNEYLFINHLGDKITTRGITDILDRLLELTAIEKKVSPHTFRHSFATMLLNEGANTKVVQELLGHASMKTTSIYTHLSNDKLRMEYLRAHPRAKK